MGELVRVSEAASHVGLWRQALDYWIRRGFLRVHESKPVRLVDLDEVETVILIPARFTVMSCQT